MHCRPSISGLACRRSRRGAASLSEPCPAGFAFPHRSGQLVHTLPAAFQATVALYRNATALVSHDRGHRYSWDDYATAVRAIAEGLLALAVARGDTVGLMLTNRPEFHLVDTAALHVGAVPFSIYTTMSPQQIASVCANAANRIIFTERRFLPLLQRTGGRFEAVICVDGSESGTMPLAQLMRLRTRASNFEAVWSGVRPHDLATVSYTAGTTGTPRGVELSHANILSQLMGLSEHLPVGPRDRILSYLPAAHIADRVTAHYAAMAHGVRVVTLEDPTQFARAMSATRPTVVFGVPQVWQRIQRAIDRSVDTHPQSAQRRIGRWALDISVRTARADAVGQYPGFRPRIKYGLAKHLVLPRILRTAGLAELRFAASGAAPPATGTIEFFRALGIPLTQVWGLTEATGVCTTTSPTDPGAGSVGRGLSGVEIRLDPDGEVLVRSPMVMRGYRGDEYSTRQVVDQDGWLRTGDLGAVDVDGALHVIGRKSEMIITDDGQNIAPVPVENAVVAGSSLIGHVLVIGDRRPYLTALITLDEDAIAADARFEQIEPAPIDILCERPGIRHAVAAAVLAANAAVSGPEQIVRFILLDHVWRPGGPEVTAKLSLRRRAIEQRYAEEVELLYQPTRSPRVIDVELPPERRRRLAD
ncbi:AMP-binding protein [Nocardia asteroides]